MLYKKDNSIIEIFKDDDLVTVYKSSKYPDEVCKRFSYVSECMQKKEDLKEYRKKLIAIKNHEDWPDYIIRPSYIGNMQELGFTVRYPFVEGDTLGEYLINNDIDIVKCAKFIKLVEERVLNSELIFPDIANPGNIKIKMNGSELDFLLIDPDDIQFEGYKAYKISPFVKPCYGKLDKVYGLYKCFEKKRGPVRLEDRMLTKEIDIRSMYALLYYIINGQNTFYPIFWERKFDEYKKILDDMNIPRNSELYEKSLLTLVEHINSEPIGDSLFKLINEGYEFETFGKNQLGFQHKLKIK